MKKIIAIALALVMLLSLSVSAWADNVNTDDLVKQRTGAKWQRTLHRHIAQCLICRCEALAVFATGRRHHQRGLFAHRRTPVERKLKVLSRKKIRQSNCRFALKRRFACKRGRPHAQTVEESGRVDKRNRRRRQSVAPAHREALSPRPKKQALMFYPLAHRTPAKPA